MKERFHQSEKVKNDHQAKLGTHGISLYSPAIMETGLASYY